MKIPSLPSLISYRQAVYFATVLTGFSALCAQVVWQRYLSVLVGSEARSLTLVVAIFLLGLASGYYVFGRLTERKWSRFWLLKIYGYTELLTGLYIFFFYLYFELLKTLSFQGPSHLLFDIVIAFLALLLPTFLMGASIPVLTATLPEDSRELSFIHSRIYGWNTLGAFFGTLVSGFYLLPALGLKLTLMLAGLVNVFAALVYIGNRLEGEVRQQEAPPLLHSAAPNWFYLLFSFLAGGVIVSFEILFVRVLNLSIGAGVYNFPIVLSIFVGALALGSLSLQDRKFSVEFLIRQVLCTLVLLGILYVTAPYWSFWLSHVRVSLVTLSSNYYVFKFLVYVFLLLLLGPAVFFMGRLLPLVYSLLRKNQENYGLVCGHLYFFNTLGTVLGTVVIGYLAFYFLDLDQSIKINLFILLALVLAISLFEKKRAAVALSVVLGVVLLSLPRWDRSGHYFGYFHAPVLTTEHFKKIFYLPPSSDIQTLFFEDGPNTTVTVARLELPEGSLTRLQKLLPEAAYNYAISVNGKSDGNLVGDFSTMVLTATVPYLYAPAPEPPSAKLSAAVIGLGTGISAGILGQQEEIEAVTVLEISPKVVQGIREAASFNFAALSNPKVEVVESDAFKYFTKSKRVFDIIVSEPSNPWVTGVENIFSREFYQLAVQSLSPGGVLAQWLQIYSMDEGTLRMIFNTLKQEFAYARLYQIGQGDLAIIASNEPLHPSVERFSSPSLRPIHRALGLRSAQELELAQIYSSEKIARGSASGGEIHTLTFPRLTYRADRAFFMDAQANPWEVYPTYMPEPPAVEKRRMQVLDEYLASLRTDLEVDPWIDAGIDARIDTGPTDVEVDSKPQISQGSTREQGSDPSQSSARSPALEETINRIEKRCLPLSGFGFFCRYMVFIAQHKFTYEDLEQHIYPRFSAYHELRIRGLLDHQQDFLGELKSSILADETKQHFKLLAYYIDHVLAQQQYGQARRDLELFQSKELLEEENYSWLQARIEGAEQLREAGAL